MATHYDENVLQEQAERLYSQAKSIILITTVKYALIAFLIDIVGAVMYEKINPNSGQETLFFIVVFTLVVVLAGVAAGREKAFQLKLQAQQILCQRQIEVNTRPLK